MKCRNSLNPYTNWQICFIPDIKNKLLTISAVQRPSNKLQRQNYVLKLNLNPKRKHLVFGRNIEQRGPAVCMGYDKLQCRTALLHWTDNFFWRFWISIYLWLYHCKGRKIARTKCSWNQAGKKVQEWKTDRSLSISFYHLHCSFFN